MEQGDGRDRIGGIALPRMLAQAGRGVEVAPRHRRAHDWSEGRCALNDSTPSRIRDDGSSRPLANVFTLEVRDFAAERDFYRRLG